MDAQQESADELLARARRVYAECSSYSDEGTHTTRYHSPGPDVDLSWASRIRFRTRWKRPNWFLFEYWDLGRIQRVDGVVEKREPYGGHYVVWSTPEGVRSWWTLRPVVQVHESLDYALAGAAGVSGGTSHRTASLLRAIESDAQWFPHPQGFTGQLEVQSGVECSRIAIQADNNHAVLWLDRSSALVRRYDTGSELPEGFLSTLQAEVLRQVSGTKADESGTTAVRENVLHNLELGSKQLSRAVQTHQVTSIDPTLDPELKPEDFEFVPPSSP